MSSDQWRTRLALGDHRRVHAAKLRPPLVERRIGAAGIWSPGSNPIRPYSRARGTTGPPAHRLRPAAGSQGSVHRGLHGPTAARVPSSSVYLLVFILNLFVDPAEKILFLQPLTFRRDYRSDRPATDKPLPSPALDPALNGAAGNGETLALHVSPDLGQAIDLEVRGENTGNLGLQSHILPRGPELPLKTCSLFCLSSRHPLRRWSLRQSRGGSAVSKFEFSDPNVW